MKELDVRDNLMERRMRWKSHVRCELGEKPEIGSKAYLSVFEAYSVEELTEMILDGTIMDAKTVSAILAYKAKYKK